MQNEVKQNSQLITERPEFSTVTGKRRTIIIHKIILGDFNAKVGREDFHRDTTGAHSLHAISNNNGFRAIEFAQSKDLQIKSTFLPRKDIYKMTRRSPDGRTFNQIDHVLIQNRSAHYITDVKSRRGANCDTDHYLVKIKFRSHFITKQRKRKPKAIRKFDVSKLSADEYRIKYEEALATCNSEIEEDTTIEDQWTTLKNHIEESAGGMV